MAGSRTGDGVVLQRVCSFARRSPFRTALRAQADRAEAPAPLASGARGATAAAHGMPARGDLKAPQSAAVARRRVRFVCGERHPPHAVAELRPRGNQCLIQDGERHIPRRGSGQRRLEGCMARKTDTVSPHLLRGGHDPAAPPCARERQGRLLQAPPLRVPASRYSLRLACAPRS